MTIGRAPGASLVLVRPVGLARARADLRRRGARGRRLQPRDVAGRRAGDRPAAAARRREDPARRRRAAGRAPPRRRRGRAHDRRAAGRVALAAADAGAARRGHAVRDAARACARATRSSGWTPPRGAGAGCCATSSRARSCGSPTTTPCCSSCSTARTRWSSWCGSSEQRFGATGPARLARLLTDLGERGFLEGVAGGAAAGRGADEPLAQAVQAAREGLHRRRAADRVRSTARGGWVFFTRPVLIGSWRR